jgi:hypothetical protein
MSNFLAVATVSAALSQVVRSAVRTDVSGADVTTLRPDWTGGTIPGTRVNLFLYQVTPNAAWRNTDLPTRNGDGNLVQRPRAALDLHYLLTFYGDEGQLEPQRLLGSAVRALHTAAILTRQTIHDTITNVAFSSFLAGSDLANDVELVKFTPIPLSLEELSKLWSVFFQTQYTLSVAYQGTVVLIEPTEAPRSALPVRSRQVHVVPFRRPTIDTIEPQMVDRVPDAKITLHGRDLLGDDTLAVFGQIETRPEPAATNEHLVVTLPIDLRAGVNPVQVVHRLLMGAPTPHRGFESNVAAFVLRPALNSVVYTGGARPRLTADVSPGVGAEQRVLLLLNQIAIPGVKPLAYSLPARPRALDTDPLVFNAAQVPAGTYLVRVRVDGAESSLAVESDQTKRTHNQDVGPTVIIG